MTADHYSLLAALIFALVAVLQIVRAVAGLRVTIGRTSIPISASWVVVGECQDSWRPYFVTILPIVEASALAGCI
jgi:hypothetical protein